MGKWIFSIAVLGFSLIAGARPVEDSDLTGYFKLRSMTGSGHVSQIHINQDGSYSFRQSAGGSSPTPEPGCLGTSTLNGGKFIGELKCESESGETSPFRQEIVISGLEIEDLEGPGAIVEVQISAEGSLAEPKVERFLMTRERESYFPETIAVYTGTHALAGQNQPCSLQVRNVSQPSSPVPLSLDIEAEFDGFRKVEDYSGRLFIEPSGASHSHSYKSSVEVDSNRAELIVQSNLIKSFRISSGGASLVCNIQVQILE